MLFISCHPRTWQSWHSWHYPLGFASPSWRWELRPWPGFSGLEYYHPCAGEPLLRWTENFLLGGARGRWGRGTLVPAHSPSGWHIMTASLNWRDLTTHPEMTSAICLLLPKSSVWIINRWQNTLYQLYKVIQVLSLFLSFIVRTYKHTNTDNWLEHWQQRAFLRLCIFSSLPPIPSHEI